MSNGILKKALYTGVILKTASGKSGSANVLPVENFAFILKKKMATIADCRDGSPGPVSQYRKHFTEIQ